MSLNREEKGKVAEALMRVGHAIQLSLYKADNIALNAKIAHQEFLLKEWVAAPSPKVKVCKRSRSGIFKLVGYDVIVNLKDGDYADKKNSEKIAGSLKYRVYEEIFSNSKPHYINSKKCDIWYLIPYLRINK